MIFVTKTRGNVYENLLFLCSFIFNFISLRVCLVESFQLGRIVAFESLAKNDTFVRSVLAYHHVVSFTSWLSDSMQWNILKTFTSFQHHHQIIQFAFNNRWISVMQDVLWDKHRCHINKKSIWDNLTLFPFSKLHFTVSYYKICHHFASRWKYTLLLSDRDAIYSHMWLDQRFVFVHLALL